MISDETLSLLSQITGKPVYREEADSLFLQLNAQNAFAPNALVSELLGAISFYYQEDQAKMVDYNDHLFSDMLARDKYTGYYIHTALRTLYLDFALARASLPNQDKRNFLILGDYFNLSSVNDAIGRGATNELMATICGIYLDSLTSAGVVDCLFHRSMGDEVTFIAINTSAEKIQNGLRNAEKLTDEFIRALGLERLSHKKYEGHCGAGLVTAMTALKPDSNHRLLKQQLDDMITTRKKSQRFSGLGFFRRRGVEPHQFHTRASEQRIDEVLHNYRSYRLSGEFSSDANQTTSTRNAVKQATALLVGRAIAWPRDDRIEYLRYHHNDSKIMLRADIYNLGGLNAVYGHDGADHLKAHLIRILFSTISAYDVAEPRIFDCGGGIIDVVINTMPSHQLQNMVRAIQSNIYHQIVSLSVKAYAQAYNLSFAGDGEALLGDLPHPKGENRGTGLIMATHAINRTYSLPEIIERLDKISNRTKMHDLAYLWHDENHTVWGLALNGNAEPIEIGPDRIDAGPHYLPFTDALRDYLDADDLPLIFERPVGQICEILFGTDMQAVLGFKKAIRMLQEKNVTDDTIENINSYTAMDLMLRQTGLPPLSVVSTQNRPAFIRDERPSFKTMTLAEKLEGLPSHLTSLILQTQASFRTLRLIMPHGHLSASAAASVLVEELNTPDTTLYDDFVNRLHRLARLLDRGFGVLERDMPDDVCSALRDFSLDTLEATAIAFDAADESLLAKKLQLYIREQGKPTQSDALLRLDVLRRATAQLIDKIQRKKVVKAEMLDKMRQTSTGLLHDIQMALEDPVLRHSRG